MPGRVGSGKRLICYTIKMSIHLETLSNLIVPILKKYQVHKAGLFGSVLREDFSVDSDVDVLLELNDQNVSHYFDIKSDLEQALHRDVDLMQYNKLHHRIKHKILSEQVSLPL